MKFKLYVFFTLFFVNLVCADISGTKEQNYKVQDLIDELENGATLNDIDISLQKVKIFIDKNSDKIDCNMLLRSLVKKLVLFENIEQDSTKIKNIFTQAYQILKSAQVDKKINKEWVDKKINWVNSKIEFFNKKQEEKDR